VRRVTPEDEDAIRRTRLANERTYLAWWRGGLTAIAVALGVGALLPELSEGRRWPFVVLGIGFALLAVIFIAHGVQRFRAVERALARGGFAPLDLRVATVLAALGVALAVLTIVAVVVEF
jgi:putative membrane protein